MLIFFISEPLKLKLNISIFSRSRLGVTDFGITVHPRSIFHRNAICAGVFLYRVPISNNVVSCKSLGSFGFAHGRSGEPSGENVVTTKPLLLHECISFSLGK